MYWYTPTSDEQVAGELPQREKARSDIGLPHELSGVAGLQYGSLK